MTPLIEWLPIAGTSGVVGMVAMKGIDWMRGRSRDTAQTDAIVRQTYGRLIGDLRADLDRMKADMKARDEQCERDIAALKNQIAHLQESKHAMATIVRSLVNKRPVPKNHQAMLDSLVAIDPGLEAEA